MSAAQSVVVDDSRTGSRGPAPLIPRKQLEAAHVLHTRGALSITDVASLLYEPLGYASPTTCRRALRSGWYRLGLEMSDHRRRKDRR